MKKMMTILSPLITYRKMTPEALLPDGQNTVRVIPVPAISSSTGGTGTGLTMLDLRLIREETERVRRAQQLRDRVAKLLRSPLLRALIRA